MSPSSAQLAHFPKRSELHGALRNTAWQAAPVQSESLRGKSERMNLRAGAGLAGVLALAFGLPSIPAAADAASQDSKGVVPSEDSWVNLQSDELVDTGELAGTAAAASRARMRTPVLENGCVPLAGAANGSRTLTRQQRFYMPLASGTYSTSSGYGYRVHPTTGQYSFHEGDDFQAPAGTAIYAVADGVVVAVGYAGTAGLRTVIEHTDTDGGMVQTAYLHQLPGSPTVSVGQEVSAGQMIGQVGTTGRSTGPHLHFEVRPGGGDSVHPTAWLATHEAVYVGQECS